MSDFFVSYNKADETYAEWIAWNLEDAGYTTVIQVWDFKAGHNFVKFNAQSNRRSGSYHCSPFARLLVVKIYHARMGRCICERS